MFCIIINQTEANVWLTSVALDQLWRILILVTYASSQWRGKQFLIEHVVNVKTLNGRDLLKDDMDFMLSQVVENMTDDILNDDLDFLLSQVAEGMENEYKCEQDLNSLAISQCITSYL